VTLVAAYTRGADAALARFKLANSMGANAGVQPRGDEFSHGTERIPYTRRDTSNDGAPVEASSSARTNMPAWLWDHFTTYDNIAPGRADGSFGQEVIG
jgi:hypothetical protein